MYEVRKLKPDPETLSRPQGTSIVFGAERSNQVDSWPFKSGNTNLFYNRGERIIRCSNIIRILDAEYLYSYSYSGDFLKPNIIRIRIRAIFSNRILFVFVFG